MAVLASIPEDILRAESVGRVMSAAVIDRTFDTWYFNVWGR